MKIFFSLTLNSVWSDSKLESDFHSIRDISNLPNQLVVVLLKRIISAGTKGQNPLVQVEAQYRNILYRNRKTG